MSGRRTQHSRITIGAFNPDEVGGTPEKSAAKFSAGECIMAKDGYIWKIARIDNGQYFSMGWQGNGWGNEANFEIGHFEKLGYQSSPCPEVQAR